MSDALTQGAVPAPADRTSIPDPDRLQRMAADPRRNVWVAASAGSGKTKVLTDRVLALLLTGSPPERLLCITFTKAAASEMANRVAQRLGKWTRIDDTALDEEITAILGTPPDDAMRRHARRLFAAVLDAPGGMQIKTIHSFCQSVLGRFPLESGTPPRFEVMDDRTAGELMQGARDAVLATAQDDAVLGGAVAAISKRLLEDRFDTLLRKLSGERTRLGRLLGPDGGGLDATLARLFRVLEAQPGVDEDALIAAACAEEAFDRDGLARARDALRSHGSPSRDAKRADTVERWLALDLAGRIDFFPAYRRLFITSTGTPAKKVAEGKVPTEAPDALSVLEAEQDRILALDGRIKRQVTARCSEALLRLAARMLETYERGKKARSLLDYDDLILRTRDLLDPVNGAASWVMFKLDGGLEHILVDEAQDTSPEQWDIVRALAEEFFAGEGRAEGERTLFVVGDVKQSIYSFQRADPRKFVEMRQFFEERIAEARSRLHGVEMPVSFRSTQAVLDAVDASFAAEDARDGLVEAGQRMRHYAHRRDAPGRVELWPLVSRSEPVDYPPWSPPGEPESDSPADERLADGLARRIAGWVGRSWLPRQGRMVRAGDILILVRSRTALVERMIRALKRHGVPVAGRDRMVLSEQLAVRDLVALSQFLLLPEDDMTLAVVLKGPFIGMDDDDLFRIAHNRGKVALWDRLRDLARTGDTRMVAAASWLSALLSGVDRQPPYELFSEILTQECPALDRPAGPVAGRLAMLERLGLEAEDALDEFLNLALAYDERQTPALQGFLHWFAAGEEEIKRDAEAAAKDELRIMTVHGSKGLQAPIVIMPDTVAGPGRRGGSDPTLYWIDGEDGAPIPVWPPNAAFIDGPCEVEREAMRRREAQEYRRLLYVAMTRAEDRLYICGAERRQAHPEDCWYEMVRRGLDAAAEARSEPFDGGAGWEGDMLTLTSEGEGPAAAESGAEDDAAGGAPPAAPAVRPDWLDRAPVPEPTPPQPVAPSRPEIADPPARSPLAGDDSGIFQRGLLVHRLLQFLPDLPADRREAAALRYLSRPGAGLGEAASRALFSEVEAVLDDPDFAAIFGPGSRAEVPLTGVVDLGGGPRVVSGQVDRLLVAPDAVYVIDYKTLRPPPEVEADIPPAYLSQLSGYAALLRGVFPDKAVRCALLWTDGPRLMQVSESLLKQ